MSHSATTQSDNGFYMLVMAAGSGTRAGGDIPKQYQYINGKPLLRHTLEACLALPGLKALRVVINPAHADLYEIATKGLHLPKPLHGGETRQQSVALALAGWADLPGEARLLIHDAARPFLKQDDVRKLRDALREHQAATLCTPVADTLRRGALSGGLPTLREAVERNELLALQTPQGFEVDLLRRAHQNTRAGENYSDDTSLVSAMGVTVCAVEGSPGNFKITTNQDFERARMIMESTKEYRTGTGFDVHAFSDDPNRALMLCGVRIEGERALAGHSDADVGMHALTDAILGALSLGDIGTHFPPSNLAYKNMSSRVFLEKAADLMAERGAELINADITLICEAPKIGPHREAMQAALARILNVGEGRISIKATTTEKLGFTGRGEGIAAQAAVSLRCRGTHL